MLQNQAHYAQNNNLNYAMVSDKVKFKMFESKILVDFHTLSDVFTFCLYFVKFNTLMSLHLSKYSYKITVDSLKTLPQNVNVFVKSVFCTKSLPIMLAICLMLLSFYYAQNYAGIIGSNLIHGRTTYPWM